MTQHKRKKKRRRVAMLVMWDQAGSSSGNEEEARKRQEEVDKRHEEEIRKTEEWEARLREQLEVLRSVEGHSDPPPPRVTWVQLFSEQIDGTPIPPQFRELVVDPFDSLQDSCVHLQAFQT
ncbi:hypothetical protein CR513_20591, partial [Mucuna pruriens]